MPSRRAVANELAILFRLLSHPDRIALIEELRVGDRNVSDLAEALDLPAARVSQHLSSLRTLKLVEVQTQGRAHYYRLTDPELAAWIVGGIDFVANRVGGVGDEDIRKARELWGLAS